MEWRAKASALQEADGLVSVSRATAAALASLRPHLLTNRTLHTGSNGVDTQRFHRWPMP